MPGPGLDVQLDAIRSDMGDFAGIFTDPITGIQYDAFTQAMPDPKIMREQPVIALGQPSRALEQMTGVSSVPRPVKREMLADFQMAIEGSMTVPEGLLALQTRLEGSRREAASVYGTNREVPEGFNDTHWDGYIGDTFVMRPVIDTQTLSDNNETNTVLTGFMPAPDGNASGIGFVDGTHWGGPMQPGVTVLAEDRVWAPGRPTLGSDIPWAGGGAPNLPSISGFVPRAPENTNARFDPGFIPAGAQLPAPPSVSERPGWDATQMQSHGAGMMGMEPPPLPYRLDLPAAQHSARDTTQSGQRPIASAPVPYQLALPTASDGAARDGSQTAFRADAGGVPNMMSSGSYQQLSIPLASDGAARDTTQVAYRVDPGAGAMMPPHAAQWQGLPTASDGRAWDATQAAPRFTAGNMMQGAFSGSGSLAVGQASDAGIRATNMSDMNGWAALRAQAGSDVIVTNGSGVVAVASDARAHQTPGQMYMVGQSHNGNMGAFMQMSGVPAPATASDALPRQARDVMASQSAGIMPTGNGMAVPAFNLATAVDGGSNAGRDARLVSGGQLAQTHAGLPMGMDANAVRPITVTDNDRAVDAMFALSQQYLNAEGFNTNHRLPGAWDGRGVRDAGSGTYRVGTGNAPGEWGVGGIPGGGAAMRDQITRERAGSEGPGRVAANGTLFWTGQSIGSDRLEVTYSDGDRYQDASDDPEKHMRHTSLVRETYAAAHPKDAARYRNKYHVAPRAGKVILNQETKRMLCHPHMAARDGALAAQRARLEAAAAAPDPSMFAQAVAYESDA